MTLGIPLSRVKNTGSGLNTNSVEDSIGGKNDFKPGKILYDTSNIAFWLKIAWDIIIWFFFMLPYGF
jgi:hypothetical protein